MTPKNLKCSLGYVFFALFNTFYLTSCNKDLTPTPYGSIKFSRTSFRTSMLDAANLTEKGTILREEWDNISGNDVTDIPVTTSPSSSSQVASLEGAQNYGSNYGDRFRGYIYPPETGDYTFWIAADDSGELWLSTDDNPGNKVKIASTLSWTNFEEWTKFPSQQSQQIRLIANHKYYIEVLHQQGGGGDNVSVQWMLPNAITETPIPGSRLSPYISLTGTILREEWDNVTGNDVVDIPLDTPPASTTMITALEGVQNYGYNYGDRIRGFIYPPTSGNYIFSIAADDAGELWLSSDKDPANKVKIAGTLSWTNFREWNRFASQQSAPIALQANQKYYIEVLHKQGGGGDNLSVQWMLPDNMMETPIPGSRLSPYVATAVASAYTPSDVINLDGAHDISISGKSINGGTGPAITLTNCHNIHITQNKLCNSTNVGVYLYNCANITIDHNYFTNVSSGVYAQQTTGGGIIVNSNQFLNMQGPFPRGQFVQFNTVSGPNNSISNNKGENIFGQSYPEDAISLYQSNGTAWSPIKIVGNWIRGGGPSASGGGIMLGDNGGSYLTATNNILVDPGEYGMAIAGGDHNVITNNLIYGRQQYFTNVGLYVNSINGYAATNCTVANNQVNFFNSSNYNNNAWLAPGVDKPDGWDGNNWGANIDSLILPAVFITYQ